MSRQPMQCVVSVKNILIHYISALYELKRLLMASVNTEKGIDHAR